MLVGRTTHSGTLSGIDCIKLKEDEAEPGKKLKSRTSLSKGLDRGRHTFDYSPALIAIEQFWSKPADRQ